MRRYPWPLTWALWLTAAAGGLAYGVVISRRPVP
jgi:hypothetical protein